MYRVLIVEDDPMVSMINEQYVRKNKEFAVVSSLRNGKDALAFLEKNRVDLIILDVFMPYLDGIETLKKIREQKIDSEVIMVTAANDAQTLEETMHLGVLDYLVKPFAFERLQVALEKFKMQKNALKENQVFDQKSIDRLLSNSGFSGNRAGIRREGEKNYPKGIQEATLKRFSEYFGENSGWNSTDTISERLSVSIVTARHYLNYLVSQNQIEEDVNYDTGGRPCMLYRRILPNPKTADIR